MNILKYVKQDKSTFLARWGKMSRNDDSMVLRVVFWYPHMYWIYLDFHRGGKGICLGT